MAVIRLPPLTQDIRVNASSLDRAIAKAKRFEAAMDRSLEVDEQSFTERLKRIDDAVDKSAKQARKASRDFTELQRAYDETGQNAERGATGIERINDGMRDNERSTERARDNLEELNQSIEDTSHSARTLGQRLRETGGDTDTFSDRIRRSRADVDRHGNSLGGLTRRLRGLKLGFLGVGIAALIPAIAQLVPLASGLGAMIAPVAGLAAALPALGLGMAGVVGVLIAGFKGNEALKNSFSDLGTRLSYVKDQIQAEITPAFQGLFDAVGDAAPFIAASARVISQGIAGATREFETLFRSEAFLTDFTDVFQGFGALIPTIGSGLRDIVSAFTSLSVAGLPVVRQMVEGFNGMAQRFSAFIESARNSGQLTNFLQNAYDTTKRLFGIIGDAGSALSNLGSLANASGLTETLFGGIERGMASFREFTQLSNGPVLAAFQNVNRTAAALGPIFTNLGVAILTTLSAVDLVPILNGISSAIPPLARGIGNIVGKLSDFATAITPIIGTVGRGFSNFIDSVSPAVDDFVDGVGAAVPKIQDFLDVVFDIASAAGPPLISFFTTLVNTFSTFLPLVTGVGRFIGGLVEAFGDLPGPIQTAVLAFAALKIATSFLGSSAAGGASGGFLGSIRTGFQNAAGSILRSSSEIVAAYGRVANATTRTISATGAETQLIRTGTAMGGLGAAARTAASQGFGALRSAGAGLFGAMGGPWGVAIVGAIALIGSYANAQRKSAEQLKQAKTAGDQLVDTYARLGAVVGNQQSEARNIAIEQAGLSEAFSNAGISARDQTLALQGNAEAQRRVSQALTDARQEEEDSTAPLAAVWDRLTGAYNDNEEAAQALFDQVGQDEITRYDLLSRVVSTAGTALEQYKEDVTNVIGPGAIANQTVGDITVAMRELGGAAGDASAQVDAVTRILQGLTPQVATADSVTAQATTTISEMAAAFANVEDGAINASKEIDLNSEAGARLYQSLQNQASGYQSLIANTYAATEATSGAAAASAAAGEQAQALRDAFIQSAIGAGISEEAANNYADQLGLIPGEIVTQVTQPGMGPSQLAANILRDNVLAVPNSKTIITSALTSSSIQALQALGFKVETLPDGTVQVTADTASAQSTLNSFINKPRNISVNVTYAATNGIRGVNGSVPLNFAGAIRSPDNVQMFAGGGFSGANKMRANWASIVPPKTWRVVGDRSQDNEAFIPINNSKRSQSILRKTAGEMGYGLVKAYADGGQARQSLTTYRPTITMPRINNTAVPQTSVALPSSIGVSVKIGERELNDYIDTRIEAKTASSDIASGRALTTNTR